MPLNAQHLLDFQLGLERVQLTAQGTILYALGAGFGHDPADCEQLRYVYERDLRASPTMACVIGQARPWIHRHPEFGVTKSGVLHGEQGFTIHSALPAQGPVIARTVVTEVVDKGPQRGALVLSRTELSSDDGSLLATAESTLMCRADGGFGGASQVKQPTAPSQALPSRAPDFVYDLPTTAQQALIYRLSGDDHPLHVDPDFAREAGFDRPILHGNCTFAIAGHAILRTCCAYEASQLRAMACRFTAPVYPGETVRTEIWRDNDRLQFRCTVPERDVVVLSNGSARLQEGPLP